jgi:PTH1 family peptidyl-tRNA hydrolase
LRLLRSRSVGTARSTGYAHGAYGRRCRGDIGAEYADTRHNIGFDVLDALAEASNTSFTTDRYGAVATLRSKGHTLVLLKPSTYMNLSGKAVRYWMDAGKIPPENLLVVSDDIALPFGTLRLRPKGSAGGHNGLKNISELLGTEEYARMRFGVGGDFPKGHQVEYVLGEWTDEERKALPERLKVFVDAIRSFATVGTQLTMTNFNKK